MTPEHYLMNEIMLWCGEHDYIVFRCNVGKVKTADGRYFDTGLPKGFSDLIILDNSGNVTFCETKVKPYRPTQAQLDFLQAMRNRGFKAGVCYSVDDVKKLLKIDF